MVALRETFTPRQPQWYQAAKPFKLPVDIIEAGPFPDEVAISFRSNGGMGSAMVPTEYVHRDEKTVDAFMVGEVEGYFIVALPPGTSGDRVALVSKKA